MSKKLDTSSGEHNEHVSITVVYALRLEQKYYISAVASLVTLEVRRHNELPSLILYDGRNICL